jgi:hypothetical protein
MDLRAELRMLIVRHADGTPRHRATILDGVSVTCVTEPTPPAAAMSEPSLAVVAQGVKRTVLNGVPYDYHAGQYLVVSLDLPVVGQALQATVDEPFAVFSMKLKPAAIAPLLLETVNTARPPAFSGLAISDATPELLDPIVRLLRLSSGVSSRATKARSSVRLAWPTAASPTSLVRSAGSASTTMSLCSSRISLSCPA